MYIMGTLDYPVTRPEMKGTLWHCEQCDSLISIHRSRAVDQAMCPTCPDAMLEFCGTFDSILGKRFLDA